MGFFDTIEKIQTAEMETTPQGRSDLQGEQPQEDFQIRQPAKHDQGKRPEDLSFLSPCRICGSRDFFFTLEHGFSCRACHPESTGLHVKATGDPPEFSGPVDQGNGQEIHPRTETATSSLLQSRCSIPLEAQQNFTAAWPWIKENMQVLLGAGWTRARLVRRGRFRHPMGNWGIAWNSVWKTEGLFIEIGRNGRIVFTFESCGRKVTQAAYPNT